MPSPSLALLPIPYSLVAHELPDVVGQQVGDVDRAAPVRRDEVRAVQLLCGNGQILVDLPGLRAADDQAALLADRRDVQPIVAVDVEAARLAERRPLIEERAVLIEDLDAVVVAIGDE